MSIHDDFDEFWHHYPRRVGKLAAQKAYPRARKHASREQIMAGLETFKRHLPREVEFIPHPATWLNQGRWDDEYDAPKHQRTPVIDWFEECQQIHNGECGLSQLRHHNRKLNEQHRKQAAS